MKKSFDEGMTLYKAGKLDAAQPLLCRYKAAMGNTHNPEFVNACATVHLRLKHLGEAQSTLENGIDEHRGWPASATSATRYVLDGAEIVTYA